MEQQVRVLPDDDGVRVIVCAGEFDADTLGPLEAASTLAKGGYEAATTERGAWGTRVPPSFHATPAGAGPRDVRPTDPGLVRRGQVDR
ncbi:hypothetical protein [Streptomyces sp. NPDC093093]|uniref:hypothetical protein n=1 Tax=Streptomyces sp. NPDC093093 TaxID=3366025 RepID=UPI0037F8DF49